MNAQEKLDKYSVPEPNSGGREDVMSYGLVVCSECKRELEQRGGKWFHVEALIDGRVMPICAGATAIYPELDENQRGGTEEG